MPKFCGLPHIACFVRMGLHDSVILLHAYIPLLAETCLTCADNCVGATGYDEAACRWPYSASYCAILIS